MCVHDLWVQIEEIKGCLDDEPDDDLTVDPFVSTTAMALGNMTIDDRAGIFAALPGRFVVDRLISRYFNSNDPAMSKYMIVKCRIIADHFRVVIHKPTFQKEVSFIDL
jgi:hypothetical protein